VGIKRGMDMNIGNLFAVVQSEVTEGTEDADQSAMALVWQDGLRVIMPSGNRYDGEAKPGESPDALVAHATGMIGLYARLEGRTHDPSIVVHRVPEIGQRPHPLVHLLGVQTLQITWHHPNGPDVAITPLAASVDRGERRVLSSRIVLTLPISDIRFLLRPRSLRGVFVVALSSNLLKLCKADAQRITRPLPPAAQPTGARLLP
jgi:hypothetical protein